MVTPRGLDRLLMTTAGDPYLTRLLRLAPGDPAKEVDRCAAGPLAPLACRALVHELDEGGQVSNDIVTTLFAGLARQGSMLAVLDSTDQLLSSATLVQRHGERLHRAFVSGHAANIGSRPLVAAAFLEGALRLAIVGVGNFLRTLPLLVPDDAAGLGVEYAERLPRLIGAALDVWGTDEPIGRALCGALEDLQTVPDAAADATYELGLALLRDVAIGRADVLSQSLLAARGFFARAVAADEVRDDAALYGAGVDAVMAFLRDSPADLVTARSAIQECLIRRTAGLARSHVPPWRRPRMEACYAWSRLVTILYRTGQAVTEEAWLDAWRALDAVLDGYVLDRTVVPIPGVAGAEGFSRMVRPFIEKSLGGRQILLVQLNRASLKAEQSSEPPARLEQLRLLHAKVRGGEQPAVRADPDIGVRDRLLSTAPTLLKELGETNAAAVAGQLSDDALRMVEGVIYRGRVTREVGRHPVLARLLDRLAVELHACPDYTGSVRHAFDALVEEVVMFLATRHDLQRSAGVEYLTAAKPPPREVRLQDDFADWLRRGRLAGRIDVEVPNVATGRADIKVGFGATRFFIEVKRELRDGGNQALERSYLVQAADYSGTNATLGVLLVLDLTPHHDGVRHLSECAWVARHRPLNSAVDRYILVAVVVGNRLPPSSYSRKGS